MTSRREKEPEDLLYLTATEALRRFADKSLSPSELLEVPIAFETACGGWFGDSQRPTIRPGA